MSTPAAAVQATLPHALHALTQHILDQHLPTPPSIEVADGGISVHVSHWDNADRVWLDSVHVDGHEMRSAVVGTPVVGAYARHEYRVRLPDTGYRVTVVVFAPPSDAPWVATP